MFTVKAIDNHVYVQNLTGSRLCEVLGAPGVDRVKRGELIAAAWRIFLAVDAIAGRPDWPHWPQPAPQPKEPTT